MSVSYVSGGTRVNTAASTTVTVPAPASRAIGNIMVALIYDQQPAAGITVTPPSGWTLVANTYDSSVGYMRIYSKIVDSGDVGANYSWVGSSSSSFYGAAILQYSGVDATTPFDGTPAMSPVTTLTNTFTTPAVTATDSDTLIASYASNNGSTFNTPSGTTARANATSSFYTNVYNNDLTVSPGSVSGISTTIIGGSTSRGYTTSILLKPAAGTIVTKTITGVARISKDVTKTQTSIGRIRALKQYSRGSYDTLPTTSGDLQTVYNSTEIGNVATVDSTFVTNTTNKLYGIHEFSDYFGVTPSSITPQWTGKVSRPASLATVYLEIYNITSNLWEVLSSNNTVAANTAFTLNGNVTTGLTNYRDSSGFATMRVRQ